MIRLTLLICCVITAVSFVTAQQIDLTGQISIYNSNYRTGQIEYVADAFVSADFAGSTNSDAEGKFELVFSGLASGTTVDLRVEKSGLEVVNKRNILHVILGRKEPLKVFLAPKGELAQRQTKFYNVSLAIVTARHDALIASLRAGGMSGVRTMKQLEQQLNREIENRHEAEDILREQLEVLQKRLPETARRLAEVNLDFASVAYREAYENYLLGDISIALEILEEEQLSEQVEEILVALENIGKDQHGFKLAEEEALEKASQVYKSYVLKAEAYELIFDYRSAAAVLQKGVVLLEEIKEIEDAELADAYSKLAFICRGLTEFDKALIYQKKSTTIREKAWGNSGFGMALTYRDLSSLYGDLSAFENSEKYILKSISLTERQVADSTILSALYLDASGVYTSLGQFRTASNYIDKANRLLSGVEETQREANLIQFYTAQAYLYYEIRNDSSYLNSMRNLIKVKSQYLGKDNFTMAGSYENLGLAFQNLNQLDSAIIFYQKGLKIRRETSSLNNFVKAKIHNNLALLMSKMNRLDSARINIDSAILVLSTEFPDTKELLQVYANAASIYSLNEEYESAINFSREAIKIADKTLTEEHPQLGQVYNNLGTYFGKSNYPDSAIYYVEKAYNIQVKNLPYTELQVGQIKKNLVFLYTLRAEQRLTVRKYQLAITDYHRALKFAINKGKVFNLLGLTYYDVQDYIRAIENYEKSYEQKAISEITYLNNIGLAYAKWGKLKEAKNRFSQLERLLPESGLTFRDWGLYYVLKGRSNLALDNLDKAIQLGYDNWGGFRTESALAPLRDHYRFRALLLQAPDQKDQIHKN